MYACPPRRSAARRRPATAAPNPSGYHRTRRPRSGHPARTGSTAIVGTNSSPAYFTPTASAAGSAASKNTGHRNLAVRTMIHAAQASRDRQVAS